jgi:hypothetical protein
MQTPVLKRVGGVLCAAGVIALAVTFAMVTEVRVYAAAIEVAAILAGIWLWRGSPRAALWVRSLAVFLLAAGLSVVILAPFFQPLDLTLTQIRLNPADFAIGAALAALVVGLLLLTILELGRKEVRDMISGARIRQWEMRLPAQAGGGLVALAGLLLWLTLHGQTAELATSLASQQLGPDYRYHLSWIGSTGNGHGTSITGVVTAWNAKEIKKVLLHWETP